MNNSTSDYNSGYGKRPVWQWVLLYIVIGGAIYGLIYYFILAKKGGYQNSQSLYPTAQPQSTSQPTSTSSASSSSTTSASMQISVEGNEFAFTPSTMTVKKGQPVQLTFNNTGKYPHNLVISDLNIQTKTIQPGESDVINFTVDKVGSFPFICTIPGHADKGMKGTLIVE